MTNEELAFYLNDWFANYGVNPTEEGHDLLLELVAGNIDIPTFVKIYRQDKLQVQKADLQDSLTAVDAAISSLDIEIGGVK